MNLTKEQAAALGEKVLRDINFWSDDVESPPTVTFLPHGMADPKYNKPPEWLVSFVYGVEDFGRHPEAKAMIGIKDFDGIAYDISLRHGRIILRYDADKDKYFKVKR